MTTFTAIDFETADYGRDSACAVAAVVVSDGQITHRYSQLLRPPRSDFIFTYIHGITVPDKRFGCTVRAARKAWQELPSHKLNVVCEHLNIPLNHHDALSDAEACAKIAIEAIRLGVEV